ncbi:MAG: aspartate aminotransferase [Candidatus Doudnabacteria bacterium CG10_big_fil_rev_8_21_14_0_10_41_10]|uniref:Aminotransferase n=1 Tax=Candidatus Doudnabacteria bacterium CG10_big_fil_rev_8_21_14_0_10_41_10 TaxID=1974551 RepID=A0A2H0VE84_9BACT|nr:MAG: aspartate aminotransferase [Candidatus Doudnabacteria bacterium CG10_big_fil_rev_8_21_14_0_10_41_10]
MKLNSKISKIKESQTLKLNAKAIGLKKQGLDIINLTAGELDFDTPKVIQNEVRKKLAENKYTPVPGLTELRKNIASSVQKNYQIKTSKKNIVVTAGGKQALYEVFQTILNPGDEVLIPIPAWVSYEQQVLLTGGKPVFVPLTKTFDLDVSEIKKHFTKKTKALILNSPHNPTGAIFTKKNLEVLKKLLKNKSIFVICDDIYEKLVFSKKYILPSKILKPCKNLIIINGFSKSHALTGWRIGYVAANPDIVETIAKIQSQTSGNASVISQYAALAALKFPKTDYLQILQKRRRLVGRLLNDLPKISFNFPEGSFYFFLNIKKIDQNSKQFCQRLLKSTGILLVPGEAFRARGFVRLSFAASEKNLKTAVNRLRNFVENY